MDFGYDATTTGLQERLLAFMDEHIFPAEEVFARDQISGDHSTSLALLEDLKAEARARGLWNLFLPGAEGAGLTNLQYAPLAEITGHSPLIAPIALNCSAPDTGNIELLADFGSPAQRADWLRPLLDGDIRSAFAMTEPGVASSDARNIATSIVRDGDSYVINGRKWFISGALSPRCEVFIVMGRSNPEADPHRQQSMILVPRDAAGLTIARNLSVFGYHEDLHGGHGELIFDDVRVPIDNLIGEEGDGFSIAQARLGPGRIHHCMRLIGMAERAITLMCRRATQRSPFGKPLAEQGVIRGWIAESRVEVEQLRLLVLKTAWLMDTVGNRGAHTEIQAIKIAAPATVAAIIDRAIQVHGGAGASQDFPLAEMYVQARMLRIADGPDEVHKQSLARAELRRHQ